MTLLRVFAVCLVVGIVSVGCGGMEEKTATGAACKCGSDCDHAACAHKDGKCACKS